MNYSVTKIFRTFDDDSVVPFVVVNVCVPVSFVSNVRDAHQYVERLLSFVSKDDMVKFYDPSTPKGWFVENGHPIINVLDGHDLVDNIVEAVSGNDYVDAV